jgi:hypothetical protein
MLCSGCSIERESPAVRPGSSTATVPQATFTATDHPAPDEMTIAGIVIDKTGPVPGAVVRLQATDRFGQTDAHGEFRLSLEGLSPGQVDLTGWAEGYFCAGPVQAMPGDREVVIELQAHSGQDNPEYAWLPSFYRAGAGEDQGCAACHSGNSAGIDLLLPADEWQQDAHSQTASNPRFLTMYYGTNLAGEQSPPTRYAYSRDYGTFPLPPDPDQPYFGPGYKLDFPGTAGNCGACHLPAAAANDAYGVDPEGVSGVEAEGVPCDFCHKLWSVELDPQVGLPYPNMPGVLSMSFRRPFEGHQFFAGPLDDVAPGEDTFSELQTESSFCAACHYGVFWDTVIYNSFGEWLESPYSDPSTGRTCQDCHMPHTGASQFALTSAGGLQRDPASIFSHRMLGSSDPEFLRQGLSFHADANREGENLSVQVELVSDNTGHKYPTDSPLRQLILVVDVRDAQGVALDLIDGPTIPAWAGIGDPEQGFYAGMPGSGFALILREKWTGISPSGAYWNPTEVVEDTRLEPFETDRTEYTFDGTGHEGPTVNVRLYYRRAFITLMKQKVWTDQDLLLYERTINLPD